MAGTMLNSSIPYDPFSTSYLVKDQQQAFDFSPVALYSNPLEDFNTIDFAAESATSPELDSPLSPVSPDSLSLPVPSSAGTEWTTSFGSLSSPDVFFKSEALDSPAINPMDLSASADDIVPFGGSGQLADNSPLFPSPQLARAQNPAQVNHCARGPETKPEITVATRQSQRPTRGLKRKSTSSSCSTDSSPRSSASPPPATRRAMSGKDGAPRVAIALPPKKTAHNMIEKRYRNNLNDKISALRDAVPALRVMVHRLEGHPGSDDDDVDAGRRMTAQDFEEDLGGLTPAHKLNKATILSKATEYIAHLERKNRALARDNQGLRNKVEGFEMLMMNGASRSVWC
ncbi:hypothetical protein RB595_010633 [Gaeumannomyces hyphopodioides]